MNRKEEYFVDGFIFESSEQAELAKREIEGVEYLKSKIDLNDSDKVQQLYANIVEKEFFSGIVGFCFLKDMQEYLMDQPYVKVEDIPPIRVKVDLDETSLKKKDRQITAGQYIKNKLKVSGEKKEDKESSQVEGKLKKHSKLTQKNANVKFGLSLNKSIILNGVFLVIILIMFYIVNTSGNVNILNYKEKLENKYASWEQELIQREAVIFEKEKELGIN